MSKHAAKQHRNNYRKPHKATYERERREKRQEQQHTRQPKRHGGTIVCIIIFLGGLLWMAH